MNNTFKLTLPQKTIITMEQFYPNTSMNTISGRVTIEEKIKIKKIIKKTNKLTFFI